MLHSFIDAFLSLAVSKFSMIGNSCPRQCPRPETSTMK